MILRLWRGWTAPEDADDYERLLDEEIVPEIAAAAGDGYCGMELGRHDRGDEVAFVTIIRFDSWDAVESFAGEDYETAHIPESARELLVRYDDRARHYEVREEWSP